MANVIPILNAKPTNPTQEEFLKIQKFGLQPYDRSPNDYLRFVAKVFTAWRDPNDNILNYDPFDDKFGVDTGTSLTLQATADKSIIAYVDGFQASYNFVRLTTDEASTDLTKADNVIATNENGLITIVSENGDVITIDKSKYGEYHRFLIQPGICFIDNQLVQVVEETEWWFRQPTIKDYNSDGTPNFELGQFIIDPLNIYSLLPNKNYKIVLSYEYINQFESNSARLRFETDETAIDEPYFLIASFTTDETGYVHQTEPVNEKSFEKFKQYIIKEKINPSTNLSENYYYLRDINPQYLDKKYMSNHKNLFKHLQSQLLTILSESKISNTFHCREITEEIDPSVSSGDFIYYDGYTRRWYPAEVSRQDFDKVNGLYLKNATEGTHFLYTSGIIEVDDTYTILDSENLILRNLIPGAEYFLAEDTDTALNTMPFIDIIKVEDRRETGYFSISTEVIAKASSIEIEMIPTPNSGLPEFSRKRTFELDPLIGEQRIGQNIFWQFTPSELKDLPVFKMSGVGPILTEKLTFKVKLNMVESSIIEKNKEIIDQFKLQDTGDIEIEYVEDPNTPNEKIHQIKIDESHLYISTNGLPNTILTKGPGGSPIMKLLEVLGTTAKKDYPDLGLSIGDAFVPNVNAVYNLDDIENELRTITNDLGNVIYNSSPANFGLTEILALLGGEVTKIDETVSNLKEAKAILEENYKSARLEFQSDESIHQQKINSTGTEYQVVKDTYDSLVSQKFILEQKRNAVQVRLNEINLEISNLTSAKSTFGGSNIKLSDSINDARNQLTILNSELTTITNTISTLDANISTYSTNALNYINKAKIDQRKSFNFTLAYYAIPASTSIIDYTDKNMILQRSFSNLDYIYRLTSQSELERTNMLTAEQEYKDKLNEYTNNVINGSYSYSQQLLVSNEVIAKKSTYDAKKSFYDTTIAALMDQRTIRDDHIKPNFDFIKDSVRAELFVKVTPNTDPNSIWGNANLTEFKIELSKPLAKTVYFDFIYKEDTSDVMRLTIPAGSLNATNTVYLQTIPDTKIDAGLPKWVATDASGNIMPEIFNLNKLNQTLIDNHILLTSNPALANEPELFTLDQIAFKMNPNTINKPKQIDAKIRPVSELDALFALSLKLYNEINLREISISSRKLELDAKKSKENEIIYKKAYKDALDQQFALGTNIVNEYDSQISIYNNLRTFYKSSPETVDINLLGSNYSLDVCNSKLGTTNSLLITYGNDLTVKKADYEKAIQDLKDATEIALGEYIDSIFETNKLIDLKEKTKDKIITMHGIYDERTNLVISIHNNFNSILSSGIFNNEWISTDTFLLNKFQYENALEKQLIEIIDSVSLIPVSSIIIPKVLEYIIGTNGLQYPMDLQPWIFVKTSGKISTKNYPGATSVGIALNENTLILNIKHNKCGDISEFLNVYGNENDFIDQLDAKYYSEKFSTTKLDTLSANIKLQNTIIDLTNRVVKNQVKITRKVNNKDITILTSLTNAEMNVLDTLIGGLTPKVEGAISETEVDMYKKEYLLRIIYAKFFGNGTWFNPQEFIFGDTNSSSSWFAVPGNINLLGGSDPFNPEKTTGSILDFKTYVQKLSNDTSAQTLLLSTMESLFKNKVSLYKELDILNYILAILPEPLVDYNAKFTLLKEQYNKILQSQLKIARYNQSDDPDNTMDDFENPSLDDSFISDSSQLLVIKTKFDGLIATETATKISKETIVRNDRIAHTNISTRIAKYDFYKTFYNSLREDILGAIRYFEEKLKLANELKNYFDVKIRTMDKEYLTYYNKVNKLPNVMWDIFRINNYQRTKWNYTYLVLRIMGMQKELNNNIVNNTVQFSPINSEISELKIKKNSALAVKETAEAYAYDLQIKALEQKKTNFYNLLQNMINEFNIIQMKYAKPTITPETLLTPTYLIDELYMQNPEDYNLSYAFAPYPAYKELA